MSVHRIWMIATIVLLSMAAGVRTFAQAPARPVATAAELSRSLESIARVVGASVVEIFATSFAPGEGVVPRSADLVTTQRASGSGVIVGADGYIVTNAHVVAGAQRVRVELPVPVTGQSILANRSRSVIAKIVGVDLETDLAVIKVEQQNLAVIPFGDSEELKPGQLVLACGSPLGLQNSVSLGVVSAVARQLEPESPMIYVQTDASINPGSSGGALVDVNGRLVGINTLIMTQTGGHEGLSFAAPSNIVKSVYEQLRKTGRVRRGDIGIRVQTITPTLAAGLNLVRDYGVIVADVLPAGAAARAGVKPGDLVLALDDKVMENGRQLQVSLYRRVFGDVVTLSILRDGREMKVPVAMAERNDPLAGLAATSDPRQNIVPRLGILGVTVDRRIVQALPLVRVSSGVVVVSRVASAIDGRDGGLEVGDVIYSVNRTVVPGLGELRAALEMLKAGDAIVLQIERDGQLMFLAFTVE
jgi:serine protease Do